MKKMTRTPTRRSTNCASCTRPCPSLQTDSRAWISGGNTRETDRGGSAGIAAKMITSQDRRNALRPEPDDSLRRTSSSTKMTGSEEWKSPRHPRAAISAPLEWFDGATQFPEMKMLSPIKIPLRAPRTSPSDDPIPRNSETSRQRHPEAEGTASTSP